MESDSYSKRGYGNGFASKSRRFVAEFEGQRTLRVDEPLPQEKSPESNRTKSITSSFAPPVKDTVQRKPDLPDLSPGPGTYDVSITPLHCLQSLYTEPAQSQSAKVYSAFASQSKRTFDVLYHSVPDLPSPGVLFIEDM